jgi:hypothetical protein
VRSESKILVGIPEKKRYGEDVGIEGGILK